MTNWRKFTLGVLGLTAFVLVMLRTSYVNPYTLGIGIALVLSFPVVGNVLEHRYKSRGEQL